MPAFMCLNAQVLSQYLDGSQQELQLYELILEFCKQPVGSFRHKRAFLPLLKELQQLQGLAKPKYGYQHEKYPDVLHDTLIQVRDRLCTDFQPVMPTLRGSLVVWINEKLRLKYKVIELFSPQTIQEVPIDNRINPEGDETFADVTSDRQIDGTIRLSGIWQLIEEENREESQQFDDNLRNYFAQDPEAILRQCHPRNREDCNCYELIKRRLLKNPPDKWNEIVNDLNIHYGTITAHWNRKCEPLIQQITRNLGHQGE
ncbi:hypothetical protein ICL16_02105 [Iningainema sp. BLCCT55]|uniref:Uncharacterized protein n=2 Tax=Iningainema TaxID=1932705 RepID=A0A8J6XHU2_9CYAN|nr:hypothetical protein [Iningainema tapete BLCC-T55]